MAVESVFPRLEALPGLATETLLLMPIATIYLLWCEAGAQGAFGHSPLREFFFGSTTRGVLRASKAPVLLYH